MEIKNKDCIFLRKAQFYRGNKAITTGLRGITIYYIHNRRHYYVNKAANTTHYYFICCPTLLWCCTCDDRLHKNNTSQRDLLSLCKPFYCLCVCGCEHVHVGGCQRASYTCVYTCARSPQCTWSASSEAHL